ncbi:TSC complex subunit 1a isoform X2 [Takifugu rubripes]|uniref:TSC complex subunit 1a isoform X2 n=1 Tax=Takifugu rubripes TaxID=31033 RepID=UPI001145EFD1|nr:hamartin isoform X2 [Takifugu rubripes]
MSREQVSITELLLLVDSPELLEVEQVRAELNQLLSTDRGGAVVSSLVEHYLDSSSSQAVVLLSSIREPHHKILLEKLNESLNRPGSRLETVTLLGHLVRRQPPWVHHISRLPLLTTLLRCLKTDADVVVLITALLVLITLLPMIPQAGKQHIFDFFDVFGRLTSWSYKNPGQVPAVYLVHLRAGVYSLFHRLYGMFPCSFISYLRLHYSMKENLDTFQEVVKPMLGLVRVHPELVTGTQDYELDPSRWKSYEVHDIVMECSRLSLDPLESSCEDDMFSFREAPPSCSSLLGPPPPSSPLPQLCLGSGSPTYPPTGRQLTVNNTLIQADDVTWSPSSLCGLATPPPEQAGTGPVHLLRRTTSISGVKFPPTAPKTSLTDQVTPGQRVDEQPSTDKEVTEVTSPTVLLTSTPVHEPTSLSSAAHPHSLCFTPASSDLMDEGFAHVLRSPKLPYDALFDLTLPQTTALFIKKKTKIMEREVMEQELGGRNMDEDSWISPLEVLDQLIVHGHDAHEGLRRLSAVKWMDCSHSGGKQQSMKKGPPLEEEPQSLRSQLLLVHSQMLYERFKRQQHAIRNRRLLRRVVSTTALEEHSVAMKAQLGIQNDEIQCLKKSLEEEQRRYMRLQEETHTHAEKLQTHIQQLLQQQQDEHRETQRLQTELRECRTHLRDLEVELQKANNKAYNAEHQLTQLSLKLCSSEHLQQQIFLLNQQLILLKETNRRLTEVVERGHTHHYKEVSMLKHCAGTEYKRLKDSDVQHRQKLEAANHRAAELELQVAEKDQTILKLKKLLEESKTRSRAEFAASESRCAALSTACQTLQTEMLQLYGQIQPDCCSSGGRASPKVWAGCNSRSSPSADIRNGGVQASTSPLHLPSCSPSLLSLSPIESPLTVGSFLEQRAWELFRPTNQNEPEESQGGLELPKETELQLESPPLGQEVEESLLLIRSPSPELQTQSGTTAPPADMLLAGHLRRHDLSIMDYDETMVTPEF